MNGPNSFTSRLNTLANEMEVKWMGASELTVRVDGPYGVPPDVSQYDLVVLVAGGIGVTPCHAILRHLHLERASAEGRAGQTA
eukprot:707153-Prymnesium_polylepis.1